MKIEEAGFKISAQKEVHLTKDLAAQFYKEHEGKEFYDGLTDYMSRYFVFDFNIFLRKFCLLIFHLNFNIQKLFSFFSFLCCRLY